MTHKLSARLAAATVFSALVVAGCGSTASSPRAAAVRPAVSPAQMTQTSAQANTSTTQNQAATTAGAPAAQGTPSTAASAAASAGIPQGDGGDRDADNNGGPSDGDGNI
jgi:hypothetical protein